MKKSERHLLLKNLIENNIISKQADLLVLLHSRGIDVTQATVSRDIQELGIVKVYDDLGNIRYVCEPKKGTEPMTKSLLEELFMDLVIDITIVQFVIVVKTTLGTSNVIAAELDLLDFPEIIGTLAGVDTIVLFAKTNKEANNVYDKLRSYIKH
ncbi:arginine repressor [Vagococcus jeotgali]|uniref:arginine repressor n=1 Tax=Vagococcus jeotgali TaxID=3109030 RepID=UPI002DD7DFBD|nr:ArgR family transcriptional regulator [Vagococcus sp. B2T-5]